MGRRSVVRRGNLKESGAVVLNRKYDKAKQKQRRVFNVRAAIVRTKLQIITEIIVGKPLARVNVYSLFSGRRRRAFSGLVYFDGPG